MQDRGYIRSDVVVEPGSVQIGSIDQGTGADQNVAVNYAGSDDWQIVGVKSSNPHITAQVVETGRNDGQVSYALKVHVDKNAPAGYLDDHLMLATNDQSGSQIPVEVEGRVMPGIMVSPTALFMGVVQPGQKVTKQLVVKGKKPFRILSITCDDKSFKFDTSKDNAGQGVALDSGDVPGRLRRGQGRQDDQDQDRPGRDDARAGGLRRGGGGAIEPLDNGRINVGAAVALPPLLRCARLILRPGLTPVSCPRCDIQHHISCNSSF